MVNNLDVCLKMKSFEQKNSYEVYLTLTVLANYIAHPRDASKEFELPSQLHRALPGYNNNKLKKAQYEMK